MEATQSFRLFSHHHYILKYGNAKTHYVLMNSAEDTHVQDEQRCYTQTDWEYLLVSLWKKEKKRYGQEYDWPDPTISPFISGRLFTNRASSRFSWSIDVNEEQSNASSCSPVIITWMCDSIRPGNTLFPWRSMMCWGGREESKEEGGEPRPEEWTLPFCTYNQFLYGKGRQEDRWRERKKSETQRNTWKSQVCLWPDLRVKEGVEINRRSGVTYRRIEIQGRIETWHMV